MLSYIPELRGIGWYWAPWAVLEQPEGVWVSPIRGGCCDFMVAFLRRSRGTIHAYFCSTRGSSLHKLEIVIPVSRSLTSDAQLKRKIKIMLGEGTLLALRRA